MLELNRVIVFMLVCATFATTTVPTEVPTKVPTEVSTEVPTKVPTKKRLQFLFSIDLYGSEKVDVGLQTNVILGMYFLLLLIKIGSWF